MSRNLSAIAQGVREAWDYFLSQHDISVPATIEAAVQAAFANWLEANADDFLERLATLVAEKLRQPPQE